jgi:hypothetical protein
MGQKNNSAGQILKLSTEGILERIQLQPAVQQAGQTQTKNLGKFLSSDL